MKKYKSIPHKYILTQDPSPRLVATPLPDALKNLQKENESLKKEIKDLKEEIELKNEKGFSNYRKISNTQAP